MINVTTRQLRIFEATARLGRLTQAAEEQSLSQSAASQSLRELEQILDYRLFTREGRELKITDDGNSVLPKIRQILGVVDTLKNPNVMSLRGALRIAASLTIASYILPGAVARLLQKYPDISPHIAITNTQSVIQTLERGQALIGFIEGPCPPTELHMQPWREDSLVLFCHADYPLAKAGVIDVDEIGQHRWILREPGSGTRTVFEVELQRLGGQVRSSLILERQDAIKQSVKSGLGIGCLSSLSITEEVNSGEFVVLRSPMDLSRRFSIVTHDADSQNPLIHALLSAL
ncbi:MAG: LysR substrate-binding domain-containing protein [Pseudomonadota bacterium]